MSRNRAPRLSLSKKNGSDLAKNSIGSSQKFGAGESLAAVFANANAQDIKRRTQLTYHNRKNSERLRQSTRLWSDSDPIDNDFQNNPSSVGKRKREKTEEDSPKEVPKLLIGKGISIDSLVDPAKLKNTPADKDRIKEKDLLINSLSRSRQKLEAKYKEKADALECPYCHTEFPKQAMTDRLRRALKVVKRKDREYRKQAIEEHMKNVTSETHKKILLKELRPRRPVDSLEQHFFCCLHRAELVYKKLGKRKNYPLEINFEGIPARLNRQRGELEKIINNETKSEFRNIALDAYKDMGKNKARSAMGVFSRVDRIMTGYYGSRGNAVIADALNHMFLNSGYLTQAMTAPQYPVEYIQQVLVPEAALLLIRQDLYNKKAGKTAKKRYPTSEELADLYDEAMVILRESEEYGRAVHMAPNEIIADFSDSRLEDISLDDSSSGDEDISADS
ncbi:hypothetical protein BX666DRAFT_761868 [Dichotomocladium elegans]|nr:hypothetical protein BX666DRAFT_761868 [Dichotomocladium elegans]